MTTAQLLAETRIDPETLAKREGVGKRSVVRWMHRGIRGHLLESFLLGNRRYTTEEAYRRFVYRTSTTGAMRERGTEEAAEAALAQL